jgi:Putative beta-barrel porin-2, OmpL-like. bbp2
MFKRQGSAALAACTALICASWASASDSASNAPSSLTLTPSVYADDAAPPPKPLMALLDNVGIGKALTDWGINVSGYAEASYTYNAAVPGDRLNPGRVFDIEDESPKLNQVDLAIERGVSASPTKWDFGARMEWVYGSDARFLHSNGLFDYQGFHEGPENQFDPLQFYLEGNIPVGNGITWKAGRFVTLLGYETIAPNTNAFYSHTYLFNFALPFTNTGVLASYQFNKEWGATFAVVRGWDQTLEDNNSTASYMGQVAYTGDKLSAWLTFITGPEQTNDNGTFRTVIDGIVTYTLSDQITLAFNGDYGFEDHAAADGGHATWWGGAAYITYRFSPMFALQGRAEYFDDSDGARGLGTEAEEATGGVTFNPLPNSTYFSSLMLRPEFRWDHAGNDIFDDGTKENQYTLAIDAVYSF